MSDDLVKHLRNSKGWPTLGNAAADRIKELEAENRRLRDTIRPLKETIALADWALRGANMNMKSLEKKMNKALETLAMDLNDE